MRERKRVVTEKNTRHLVSVPPKITAPVKSTPTNPTPFVSPHGMSAQQINRVNKTIIGKRSGRTTKVVKPLKVHRPRMASPDILLEVPTNGAKNSIEYPTPEWFRNTSKVDVSVIIPIYKSHEVLGDLIDSWSLDHDLLWEIIFVDDRCPNNSKDVAIQKWFQRRNQLRAPVGRIIFNVENKGYGLACNTGAEFANGDFLIFLNADTRVTPGWIEPIVGLLKRKDIGIVGNLQIKEGGMWDGYIDGAGSEWSWQRECFDHIGRHSYHLKVLPEPMKPDEAPPDVINEAAREMVTGCCFGIRRDLFRYIGGFNPNYRVGYWEDAELSLFVRELGYKVMFTNKSKIYHKLSHTQSGSHPFAQFNKEYFFNRWVKSGRIDPLVKDKRPEIPKVNTILLRRSGANGDVLVAAGVAAALKKKHNNCQILFQTDCPAVLHNHPFIDRVLNHEQISERQFNVFYDLDMVYEYRPTANILNAYAEAVGVKTDDCNVCITPDFFNIPKDCIVIHAGNTAWSGRNWVPTRFAEVAQLLKQFGYTVVCVGSNGDNGFPCDFDLRGKTNIAQLAHIMQIAKLFVGIDSFPMHVAQAMKTPGVCFFGSVLPSTRIYRDNMHGIAAPLTCIGCHHRKQVPCVLTNTCEINDEICISLISTEMMMAKIASVVT